MKKIMLVALAVCFLTMTAGAAWCGDNGNGTVTVNGLVWLKNADCFDVQTFKYAVSAAAGLASGQCGLTDKSTAGQWQLPTRDQLIGILSYKGMFTNVKPGFYWATMIVGPFPKFQCIVDFGNNTIPEALGRDDYYRAHILFVRGR